MQTLPVYRETGASNHWTTMNGAPAWNNTQPLTAGSRGPVLLEDFHVVEKLAMFDRAIIPERVVHAVGATAKGYFECTADVSDRTCMNLFSNPGKRTPVIVRFSTVTHGRGSPESLRDPRGFAVKFYTQEGNWDLVGNNMPVFFIQDGFKFPDMVHAFKPNPINNQQEWWRIWDFFANVGPEYLHMITFLLDDVGIPQDYRHMEGFGVHTFRWYTTDGRETLVKFHWKPTAGVKSLLEDEAVMVGGKNHAHAQADLHDSIARGDFPEYVLFVQYMEPSQVSSLEFDPLDVTKTWPEDRFPLHKIGRMVLNQNTHFFGENEQVAFCPANIVPGIYFSNDKLLQTRIFSYLDTQRHRLGPHHAMLPVNAPRCAFRNTHHDGDGNWTLTNEEVNYFPSRFSPQVTVAQQRHPLPQELIEGKRVREAYPKQDYFSQARARYRSFDAARRERFIKRVIERLADPRCTLACRRTIASHMEQMDPEVGQRVKQYFGGL